MAITPPTAISNDPPEFPGLDFTFLRQEGLRHIRAMAGDTWTDHNAHDPGITILDQLCYALTDLSYRINYDIKDLLATKRGTPYEGLHSPAEILTVNPVTLLDIRKVIIDVPGVKNAWIEKVARPEPNIYYKAEDSSLNLADREGTAAPVYITGLYRVLVAQNKAINNSAIGQDVRSRLLSCRNLCEDFAEIRILDPESIILSGAIEVGLTDDINLLAANILFRVANYISPQVRFYTLAEMQGRGKAIDDIFDGPALVHGFIDDEELGSYKRETSLQTSDIIREIMDVPGVLAVNRIALASGPKAEEWYLKLDPEKTPELEVDGDKTLAALTFTRNGLRVSIDYSKAKALFAALQQGRLYRPLDEKERDIVTEAGIYRSIEKYYSIQHHFQQVYGIGDYGLPESASPVRKARAKQLKAYLMLFEQILADYFAQVGQMKHLFSSQAATPVTYFSQPLSDIVPGAKEILKRPERKKSLDALLSSTGEDEPDRIKMVNLERKNRFLNHLLARYSESLADYSLSLQGLAPQKQVAASKGLIADKLRFLKAYPQISNDRAKAFNYAIESWDTGNVSGLEKRIAAKLGIPNDHRRNLAAKGGEGFHLVEHILLRPQSEDAYQFNGYLVPKNITSFEASDRAGWVKCKSAAHGLQNGELIDIKGAGSYNGSRKVDRVLQDSFEILTSYINNTIIVFQQSAMVGQIRCTSTAHGLQPGEYIVIANSSAGTYNGTFKVESVTTDNFEIKATFSGPGTGMPLPVWTRKIKATWIRTIVDTRFLNVLQPTQAIDAFLAAAGYTGYTQCESPGHNLEAGDTIGIAGTSYYNGIYEISKVTRHSFAIKKPFTQNETGGWWTGSSRLQDPYSLQVSFVFPDWPQRFQNEQFRRFIQNTIREETPVHITAYVQWLGKGEMKAFERAYKNFLNQLRIS